MKLKRTVMTAVGVIGLMTVGLPAASACPPKPPTEIVAVPSEARNCDSKEITTTTITTRTDWELVNDVWVERPVSDTEVKTREATLEECPTKPERVVKAIPTEDKNCDSKEITITTITTTTDWVLVDNVWVKGEPVSDTVITTRAATLEECPVVVPTKPEVVVEEPAPVIELSTESEVAAEGSTAAAGSTAEAVNPLPMGAAAGQANTSGHQVAGGFAAFAGVFLLGLGNILRRRRVEG